MAIDKQALREIWLGPSGSTMDAREAHEIHKRISDSGFGRYVPGKHEGCISCAFEPIPTICPKCRRRLKFSQWSNYPMWRCGGLIGSVPLLGRFWRGLYFSHGRHYTFDLPVAKEKA